MTRREQFDKRQRKWAKRRRALNRHNNLFCVFNAATNTHGGGKIWTRIEQGQQKPLQIKGKRTSRMDPESFRSLVFTRVHGGGFATPPHSEMYGPFVDYWRSINRHFPTSFVGLHRRAVGKLGRRIGRMDGLARRVMGATWFALTEGYYPDWDPLSRHPTAADIDAGAVMPDIEWRWGVLGYQP